MVICIILRKMRILRRLVSLMLTEQVIAPGTSLRVVEPMALQRVDGTGVDSFGHDDVLIFASGDGIMSIVRSPKLGKRYNISNRQLMQATSAKPNVAQQVQKPIQQKATRPVPSDLRGKKLS
jgi:hypothetical protein